MLYEKCYNEAIYYIALEKVYFYNQITRLHRPSCVLSLYLGDTSNNKAFPSMCIDLFGLEKD